jgi:hypothetical protein
MGSGGSKTTDSKSTTAPWSAQQPYLIDAWGQAKGTYDKAINKGAYQGDTIAQPNQDQYDANQAAIDFYKGLGNTAVNNLLTGASGTATSGQDASNSAIGGYKDYLSDDSVQSNIDAANKYRQGFDVSGAVDSSMSDALRTASNETLPSLYRGAAGSGSINSNRTAISDGVVREGLGRKAADLSADYNNSAWTTGLEQANTDTKNRLGSLDSLGSLGSALTSTGYQGISSGIKSAADNLGIGAAGAQGNQELAQDVIDNSKAKWDNDTNYAWDQLANYYGITGDKNWGSESTAKETTKTTPSTLSTIGSGIGAVGGLLKK